MGVLGEEEGGSDDAFEGSVFEVFSVNNEYASSVIPLSMVFPPNHFPDSNFASWQNTMNHHHPDFLFINLVGVTELVRDDHIAEVVRQGGQFCFASKNYIFVT